MRGLRRRARLRENRACDARATLQMHLATPSGSRFGAGTGPPMRILVVEDDDDSREGLRLLLEASGHRVETAATGPDGLEKLVTGEHDAAIVDIDLPGMNGYEIARRARRLPALSGVRLIALTGYGRDKDRAAAEDAGFNLHLTKPVSFATLRRKIES